MNQVNTHSRAARAGRLLRGAGLLASGAMLAAAALVPTTASAAIPTRWAAVTGSAPGTPTNNHESTWGPDCMKIEDGNLGRTYVLDQDWELVIVKAGSESSAPGDVNTLFADAEAGQTVWADSNGSGAFDAGDKEISHIIVCGTYQESQAPSGSPSQAPSDDPSQAPSIAPSGDPSQSPSDAPSTNSQSPSIAPSGDPSTAPSATASELAVASDGSSASPSGDVQGATGTPSSVTPPPTDTVAAPVAPANDDWRVLLVVLAAATVAIIVGTRPHASKRSR